MSIEYTIDIQLTELGFPDIVPRNPSGRDAGSQSISAPQKQKVRQADAVKETSTVAAVRCKAAHPPEGVREERLKGSNGGSAAGTLATPAHRRSRRGAEVNNDSDDSDVSDVCEEEEIEDFEDEEGLHNDSSHVREYPCSVCDLQLPSQFKLQDHMNLHTGARPYCCAECGKRFCQIYNYRVHLRTHAKTNRRLIDRLMCRVCRLGFTSQGDLNAHLESTHFEKEFYECDQCKHVFTSLKACENHVKLHMNTPCFKCETCERNFPSVRALARHRRKKCRHLFKCTDCSSTFTKKTALLKHSFSHLGLLPYTCLRCHCHFRLAQLYRRHKCEPERIHCVACLREFLSQEDFEQHKKDTGCWGNQEPKTDEIRCLECGERFDTKEELKKHAGAHQRVLNCAECGKGFRSALLLMSHMGGHAGKSPCLCQICGLGFPHQQNYESHFKTCGQTPPGRAPKKRPAEKNFSSQRKLTSDSTSVKTSGAPPAATTTATTAGAPQAVPENASPESGLTDGLQSSGQQSGLNLLLFLPVCSNQTDGFSLPSALSPTLSLSTMSVQSPLLDFASSIKLPLLPPLDCETIIEPGLGDYVPLDLSMRCSSSAPPRSSNPPQSVKNGPAALEACGEAADAGRACDEVSSAKTETCTEDGV